MLFSAPFTNDGAFVQVDRSTSVGELLYTIENQNDPVNINMTEVSPYVELNPSNDRKYDTLYAPNFGKVEGAYCFRLVRLSLRASVQKLLRYSFEVSYMDSSSKHN